MSLIFGFFQLNDTNYSGTGDLFNFSLENSHWLYHVYNPNSINYVNLTKLIEKTSETIVVNDSSRDNNKVANINCNYKQHAQVDYKYNTTTIWQRVSKAKKICLIDPIPMIDQ